MEAGCSAQWFTAIGTLVLALVAIFQDRIRHWLMRPRLQLKVKVAPPDCHKTTWRLEHRAHDPNTGEDYPVVRNLPCYYFRLGVENVGNCEAREVELFARSLVRRGADGSHGEVPRFTPMNLMWAHIRRPSLPILVPHIPKVCDLAHVIRPNCRKLLGHELPGVPDNRAILAFDLQVEPNMQGHLIEPGVYRLRLALAAANALPKEYVLEINFTGDWYDDEARMLRDGFGMRLV